MAVPPADKGGGGVPGGEGTLKKSSDGLGLPNAVGSSDPPEVLLDWVLFVKVERCGRRFWDNTRGVIMNPHLPKSERGGGIAPSTASGGGSVACGGSLTRVELSTPSCGLAPPSKAAPSRRTHAIALYLTLLSSQRKGLVDYLVIDR